MTSTATGIALAPAAGLQKMEGGRRDTSGAAMKKRSRTAGLLHLRLQQHLLHLQCYIKKHQRRCSVSRRHKLLMLRWSAAGKESRSGDRRSYKRNRSEPLGS